MYKPGSQTRGPRGRFVRPAMLFGNFLIINSYVAKCLVKRRRQTIESNLNDTQCGFSSGHSNTGYISLFSKDVFTCFVDLEKAYDRVPCEKLWECCGSTVLTAAYYWPPSHCIPAQRFASVSGELTHDRSTLALDSDNEGVCCHRSF